MKDHEERMIILSWDHINSFISKSVAILFSFEVLHDFTPTQKRIKVKFTDNGIRKTNLINQGFNKSKEYIRPGALQRFAYIIILSIWLHHLKYLCLYHGPIAFRLLSFEIKLTWKLVILRWGIAVNILEKIEPRKVALRLLNSRIWISWVNMVETEIFS